MSEIFYRCKTPLIMAAAVVLLFWPAGCDRPQDRIMGKWRTTEDSTGMVWEFSKDGTVLMGSTSGRYSFGDGNRIKIQTPYAILVRQMEFSEDRMTLKDPTGSKIEFIRVK